MPLLLAMLTALAGCSSDQTARLEFRSADRQRDYVQAFPRAYVSEPKVGQYDAVLVSDGIQPNAASASGPIRSASMVPLQQILHVRVLWRPLGGTKPDTPTATNATITWIVRRTDPSRTEDRLLYQGAGLIVVDPDDNGVRFSVRSASLNLKDRKGDLEDPLGASSLSGSFYAVRNPAMVRSILAEMRIGPTTDPSVTSPPPRALGTP